MGIGRIIPRIEFDTTYNGKRAVRLWSSINEGIEILFAENRKIYIIDWKSDTRQILRTYEELESFFSSALQRKEIERLIRDWFAYIDGVIGRNPRDAYGPVIHKIVVV